LVVSGVSDTRLCEQAHKQKDYCVRLSMLLGMSTPAPQSPVVVYGANGFIGRNLLLALSGQGVDTIAVSRSIDPTFTASLSAVVRCVQQDFTDTDELFDKVVPRAPVTHVLLVSDSVPSTWTRTPSREVSRNLLSHVRFLERLKSTDRVVFLSSGGTVYGVPALRRPLRECDATEVPISAYGLTKLTIEKYLAYTARTVGFDHVTLRPSNPVGPWTRSRASQGFVSVLLRNYLADRPTPVWGDGSTTRDYHDVRDLAGAIITMCRQEELGGEVFNVGSGLGRTLNEIVALVRETLDIDPVVEMEDERGVDAPYNVLDSSHIRRTTGWKPHYDFEKTIRDTWAFMLSEQADFADGFTTNVASEE